MTERIEARYSHAFRTGWTVYFGAWVGVGAALVVVGLAMSLLPLWIIGIVICGVFLPLLVLARRRLNDPRPVIVVGEAVYHDRRLGRAIPWSEISGMSRHQPGRRIFLPIDVAEPERYLGNAGMLARPMQRFDPKIGFPVIGSNLSGMDVRQERIADAVDAWWAAKGGVSPALS